MSRAGLVFSKVLLVCLAAGAGFLLAQEAMRIAEANLALWTLTAFGARDVHGAGGTTLLLVPRERAAFHVLITPSCSAVASVLAFACLAPLVPSRTTTRKIAAFAIAAVMVVTGNLLRITGSLAIGLVAGRSSLVLFHDWVGSMFTVVYTLTGYIVMLRFLLPPDAHRRAEADLRNAVYAG